LTKEEKRVQIALGTYLQTKWKEYSKLYAEAKSLCINGYKLVNEGYKIYNMHTSFFFSSKEVAQCVEEQNYKFHNEGIKLYREGRKIYFSGHTLEVNGQTLFIDAVKEVYGQDVSVKWFYNNRKCIINDRIVFE
jgi:hypothetical protein